LEESVAIRRSLAVPAAIPLVLAACASVDVRTVTSPGANLAALRTFGVMSSAEPKAPATQSANDPMLVNSISNRALRTDLVKGFENRGYILSDNPDFKVAYYASTKEKLGTVIVDVIDPKSKELLWRGQGVASVPDDEAQYEQELLKTVTAILAKFPAAAKAS
jgi:hypothetical protein